MRSNLKTFVVDKAFSERFKERCDVECRTQSLVLRRLMEMWLDGDIKL